MKHTNCQIMKLNIWVKTYNITPIHKNDSFIRNKNVQMNDTVTLAFIVHSILPAFRCPKIVFRCSTRIPCFNWDKWGWWKGTWWAAFKPNEDTDCLILTIIYKERTTLLSNWAFFFFLIIFLYSFFYSKFCKPQYTLS